MPKQATLTSVFLRNITLSPRTNGQDFKVEYTPQDTMKKVLKKTTYLNEEIEPFPLKRLKQGLGPSRAPQREGSGAQEGYRLSDVGGKEEVPSRYEELDNLTS